MASDPKARGLLWKGFEALVVLTLALLAMANPGTFPGQPQHWGGFSSGSWGGPPEFPEFDEHSYLFGIIDAAVGISAAYPDLLCKFEWAVNPYFADAATAVDEAGYSYQVHAFWFLTSNSYATNTCGLNLTPYQWGEQQANWFLFFVAISGYSGPVRQMLGNVERVVGTECDTDLARWKCDTLANNRQVIRGFEETLANQIGEWNTGVYSSVGEWPAIVGDAGVSSVGTEYVWMASYGPSQSQLDEQAQYFDNLGYRIFSWQYANDICQMAYSDAATIAKNAAVYVAR